MKFGTAAAFTVLLGCLVPPAEAQTSARIVEVLVDDLRFKSSETHAPHGGSNLITRHPPPRATGSH